MAPVRFVQRCVRVLEEDPDSPDFNLSDIELKECLVFDQNEWHVLRVDHSCVRVLEEKPGSPGFNLSSDDEESSAEWVGSFMFAC